MVKTMFSVWLRLCRVRAEKLRINYLCVLLFLYVTGSVCCGSLYSESYKDADPGIIEKVKAQLIGGGINDEIKVHLNGMGLNSLSSLTCSYLKEEKNPEHFNGYMDFLGGSISGREVLKQVYSRLLIDIQESSSRVRILRSIVDVLGDKGKVFLISELENNDPAVVKGILTLLPRYRSPETNKVIKRFLKKKEMRAEAVKALGAIGLRENIPVLIDLLEKWGSGKAKGAVAESLKQITGYDFGTRYTVWEIWWNKYGSSFEEKRLLRDFRIVGNVEDYSPIVTEYFDYFFSSLSSFDKDSLYSDLKAEDYIVRIIRSPETWRGVLFSLTGEVARVEEVAEKNCYIISLRLAPYPLCQVIVPDSPPVTGVRSEFSAVFYKLSGEPRHAQPVVLFVGRTKSFFIKAGTQIEHLIERFRNSDIAIRNKAQEEIIAFEEDAVPYLIKAIQENKDIHVRAISLIVLAEIDPDTALPFIEEYLVSDHQLLKSCAEMTLEKIFEEYKDTEKDLPQRHYQDAD